MQVGFIYGSHNDVIFRHNEREGAVAIGSYSNVGMIEDTFTVNKNIQSGCDKVFGRSRSGRHCYQGTCGYAIIIGLVGSDCAVRQVISKRNLVSYILELCVYPHPIGIFGHSEGVVSRQVMSGY